MNPSNPFGVKKIAIVNSYLQLGMVESSEVENCERFKAASRNLGIETCIFKRSEEIYDFNPDFVIPISYQEPKLTHYPTYGLFAAPTHWIAGSPRFTRNMFSYDGYLIASPLEKAWLQAIYNQLGRKLYSAFATLTAPKTTFQKRDYSKAIAGYLGVNWDGMRHQDLFMQLAHTGYIKCFGPQRKWANYPSSLYGGPVPFDGVSVLKVYGECGAGLCINHPAFDNEDAPSTRNFEVPAASAAAICSKNPFTLKHFGDTVLYVNNNASTPELAMEIVEKIEWIRSHTPQVQEMVRASHEIFNNKLSMEAVILNILAMHAEVKKELFFQDQQENSSSAFNQIDREKVTYLISVDNYDDLKNLLTDIAEQTYKNIDVLLLVKNADTFASEFGQSLTKNVFVHTYSTVQDNIKIVEHIKNAGTRWFGILKSGDRLFPNHTSSLINAYQQSTHNKSNEGIVIAFGNSLEHAQNTALTDRIQDNCMLYLSSKVRVCNITSAEQIPMGAVLVRLNDVTIHIFQSLVLNRNINIELDTTIDPGNHAIQSHSITSSSNVEPAATQAIIKIKNTKPTLNVPSNYHTTKGQLLTPS